MASGSDATDLSKELTRHFKDTPGCDPLFIEQCVGLCGRFSTSPLDLYYKWESLVLQKGIGARYIDRDTHNNLKSLLQMELGKAARSIKTGPSLRKTRGAPPASMLGFGSRMSTKNSGVGLVDTALNSQTQLAMPSLNVRKAGTSKVTFECRDIEGSSQNKRNYKYMYEKISERSGALDEHIDELADIVRQHYSLANLEDPSASTDDAVVVVGRIAIDAEVSSVSGKLNEASLYIESSRMMGSGVRVPLKFTPNFKVRGGPKGQANVGLFPGAIVALKGRNGSGDWFSVIEVMSLPPLLPPPSVLRSGGLKQEPRETSFSMTIACGPFTQDSDLLYKPWSTCVVLLIGPFVDSTNEKIKTGDTDQTPSELFHTQFTENVYDFLKASPNSLVLILPSVKDMVSHHNVYPQSPLNISGLSGDPRIKLLPNPCRFSLNDVTFAVTSVDVLFHLRKEQLVMRAEEVESLDVNGQPPATDTMACLSRHILQQRSFYPIFPSPLEFSHEVNLDVSHLEHLALGYEEAASAPDVLIVPSRLKHFSKVVDHTVTINPSFISKSVSANLMFGGEGEGLVSSRIKVDVRRFSE
ncbi:DNA polymerase alpha/epsilon subunit B-domain-containing protein [Multifurca ochricompacta]|uniref:DNA polymerase alpha subunit B n=1 Tax=Multifurca ochricompacta TaxID=376703 RepID=A0AAD4M6U9_9AGAM|nr:DNA polymerase alpha/epsilon subunit B-domain-containing protein [Multifurca ochricompacta]